MVRVWVKQTAGQYKGLFNRPAGDDTYCSNTPIANTEWFSYIMEATSGDVDGGVKADLLLDANLKTEIACEDVGQDVYISYPMMEYR
jgi:hypothetical protein